MLLHGEFDPGDEFNPDPHAGSYPTKVPAIRLVEGANPGTKPDGGKTLVVIAALARLSSTFGLIDSGDAQPSPAAARRRCPTVALEDRPLTTGLGLILLSTSTHLSGPNAPYLGTGICSWERRHHIIDLSSLPTVAHSRDSGPTPCSPSTRSLGAAFGTVTATGWLRSSVPRTLPRSPAHSPSSLFLGLKDQPQGPPWSSQSGTASCAPVGEATPKFILLPPSTFLPFSVLCCLFDKKSFGASLFAVKMKAIRRSLKGERESKPQHISITPKSAIAILPPKKVIKALYDYTPEPGNTQELAFSKGDFFHVISREDDPDWYEACNPLIPSARGLVPVSFFEVIGKNERDSSGPVDFHRQQPHDSGFSDRTDSTNTTKQGALARMSSIGKAAGHMVYGIVQYDFQAERPDELDAKAGEAIIVIAQSNPEWFVAKPIGRLGGPGLIPVSFIEIRDMTTNQPVADPLEAVRRAGVPKVEEWKKMTAEYKNSSITLGKIESGGGSGVQSVTSGMERMTMGHGGHGYAHHNGNDYGHHNSIKSQQHYRQPSQHQQQLLAPVSASVPRYCFDNDKYWYIIEAKMEDGRWWELSRYYHDFYDFQIQLLTQFEEEAGNRGKPRTLPFMPGPVTHVTDAISNGRRQNLDDYIKKLLAMPPHISRCQLVRELFAPRPGDFEIDPNALGDDYRLSAGSQQSSHDASGSTSRQSSQGQFNAGTGSYSASSGRLSHQSHLSHRTQPSLSQNNGATQSRADLQAQMMNRQPSSLTQTSTNSSGAMKVKVFFQDDIIAIRVPNDINFQQLKEKLIDRLKVNEDIIIQYKDEPTGNYVDIISDNDLETALQRNPKLTLYVNLA